ncbi:hypothetical protein [Pelagibius sp.]|uniref:hypothetical protein n=1 Tax=Pelagibius sp. TaxID=1931238 RepID=UPI002626ED32|nr:hypothetical protein [Pelagibius sp.]
MAIYSQHCAERRKGIKIWQVDPAEDGMTESYLIPSIEPSGEFGEIDSLDISCVLTEENIARVEGLIRLYMVEDLTPEAMIMRIGTQFPKVHKEPLQHPVLVSLDYGLRKHFCALRGTLANCAATYDASPTPGTPINARFSFSRSPGDSAKIEVVAQAKAGGSGLTLTYRISNSDGRLLAEGPRATVGEDMAAPGVQAVADAWLGEITDFVQENRHLFVR